MAKRQRYKTPTKKAMPSPITASDQAIINTIVAEFQDRSRKDIQKWRNAMIRAEHPEEPRWFALQDIINDIVIDGHLESVINIRKSATLNHRFYVANIQTGEQLDQQNLLLNKQWFYNFLESSLQALIHKYSIVQLLQTDNTIEVVEIPHRNISIAEQKMYLEVNGQEYINYLEVPGVIEIDHSSKFGIVNSIIPNVIWKRNAAQAWAEFGEKFGMPLITATTHNRQDVGRIESMLRALGEASQAVMPAGSEIKIHDLANAGNPVNVYQRQIQCNKDEISELIIGSSTLTGNTANRSQTEVHERTLDDKISANDKRFISFIVNDQLFPLLQSMGLPFDNNTMNFVFDETESLTISEQWTMVKEAAILYELDTDWVASTFNLPITGIRQQPVLGLNAQATAKLGAFENFR